MAAILRSPWMLCTLFLLLAGAVNAQNDLLLKPIKGEAQQPGNRIISLRSSQTKGKVRLVVETANTPDYQVYQQNDHLLLELFDTAGGQVQPDKIRDHSFIRSWEVSNPALGLFRWDIKCLYPIPAEQCRIEVLDDPHRLVVDIYTQWIEDETYQLTPGVIWNKRQYFGKICPYLLWNQITFDPKDEHLTLDIALGEDCLGKCETVSSIVSRKNALVGINGGYFNMSGGECLGLVVRGGQIISPHVSRRPPRSAFGLTNDKKSVFNRAKAVNGQILTLDNQVWPDINLALGGGPRLLADGAVQLTTDAEALGPQGNDITRSCGRTAVSADGQGNLTFTTASGYSDNHSQGIKLDQLAHLLQRGGAVNAVNLDGGGSVNMAIQGNLVAHGPEAGKYERPVANALVLYDDRPTTCPAKIDLKFEPAKITADGKSRCQIAALISDAQGNPVKDGTPVFFHAPGITATRALTVSGQAYAECTALRLSGPIPITVASGFAKAQAFIGLKYEKPERMLVRWYYKVKTYPTPQDADESFWKSETNNELPSEENISASPTPMLNSGAISESEKASNTDDAETASGAAVNSGGDKETDDKTSAPFNNSQTQPVKSPSSADANSLRMQVIDLRVRIVDKWHNGLSYQNIEIWNKEQLTGSYSTDQYGEIKASLQIPGDIAELEIRCAGLKPYKLYFNESAK